ncbi:hypothetical protein RUND412_000314 [Rhizina undulata]
MTAAFPNGRHSIIGERFPKMCVGMSFEVPFYSTLRGSGWSWGAVERFGANLNKKTVKDHVPDEEECVVDIDDNIRVMVRRVVMGVIYSEDEGETDEDEMEEEDGDDG